MINLIGSALLFITVILLAEYLANKNRIIEPEPVKLSKNEWTTDELVFLANNYSMEKTSEFGKGFVYNLILFAAHFDRYFFQKPDEYTYGVWFNGASDHLYDLTIPEKWKNTDIGKTANKIKDLALEFGHGFRDVATKEEFDLVQEMTKQLGLLIDKELGIKPIKGEYE